MNFYRAEGATLEALAAMDSIENPETDPPPYLWRDKDTFDEQTTPYDKDFWHGDMTGAEVDPVPSDFPDFPDTYYVVVNKGLQENKNPSDAELEGGIYEYIIYGHCAPPGKGATTVEIGYLKAF
jgi:hypothetical protein